MVAFDPCSWLYLAEMLGFYMGLSSLLFGIIRHIRPIFLICHNPDNFLLHFRIYCCVSKLYCLFASEILLFRH